MNNDSRVLVIGAGPCGLLTALLLARQGVPCLVIDARDSMSMHPRAMGVSVRTAEIYRQLRLLDRMLEKNLVSSDRSLSICLQSLAGEEYGRTALNEPPPEYTPCSAFHCPQPHTEEVLFEALKKEPLAELRRGVKVTHIAQTQDGVQVTLAGNAEIRVPWVIAADGAGSLVRHQLGIDAGGPGDMGHFLNVYFEADYGSRMQDRKSILYHCVSTEYSEFFVAVNGTSLWLMHHFLMPGETAEDYPQEKLLQIIRTASGFSDITPRIRSVDQWVMSPKVAEKFRDGRVFLVGDAAARLSPAGGLGMNTGLQSAHNLAWKLAAVIQGAAGDALLDSYESERRTLSLERMQSANKNVMEVFDIVQAALKGDVEIVRKIASHSRRAGSGLGAELGFSYASGAFLPDGTEESAPQDPQNTYAPSARPGRRAPHFWCEHKGRKISSLDLMNGQWVLFAGSNSRAYNWEQGARQLGISLAAYQIGDDLACDAPAVEKLYGITGDGAVLIRPDGIVAARFGEDSPSPKSDLESCLRKILAL